MRFGGYKGWVMRAIVLKEPEHLELMDLPEPKLLDAGEVLIKVEACGICGSDLRYWAGENPWALHTLGRHVDNPPNLILVAKDQTCRQSSQSDPWPRVRWCRSKSEFR